MRGKSGGAGNPFLTGAVGKPPKKKHDGGFFHALTSTPGSIAHTLAGPVAHEVNAASKAVLGADLSRVVHPVRAVEHDVAAQRATEQAYTVWKRRNPRGTPADFLKAHPAAGNAQIFPFVGPIRGALGSLLGKRAAAPLSERVLEHTRFPDEIRPGVPHPTKRVTRTIPGAEGRPFVGNLPSAPRESPYGFGKPLSGKAAGGKIIAGMSEATRLRREQQALRTVERGVRSQEVARILDTVPGEAGRRQALRAMAGPLPTLKWDRFTHFTPEAVEAARVHIRTFPALQGTQKTLTRLNTETALNRIVNGELPRKFEQKLLRDVFGDEATDQMLASVSFWKRAKGAGLNLIGVPRTLQTIADLSAPLRQGLTFGTSHPVLWGRNFKPMVQAFFSPRIHEEVMAEIASRPTFDLMQKAKLAFTGGSAITNREEAFMSSYAERIPALGKVVRASNRAFEAFLNKSRADYFDWMLERTVKYYPEIDLESEQGLKWMRDLARVAGNATGRGEFKNDTLNKALPLLNQTLFAPRLLKSRIDTIANPAMYVRLSPVARQEALKQLIGLVGTISGVLVMAKLAGARVVTDPRNADWAKVKLGNTRFDIAGGFQQPLRLMAQVQQKKIVSSTTGKTLNLGEGGGYGHLTQLDIIARFGETKLAPPPSLIVDFFRGSDFEGKPFSWKKEAYQRMVPLLLQDSIDLERQGDTDAANLAKATAIYGIGLWGVGTQTYGPRKPASSGGSISSGTNQLLGGSTGGSNPFLSGGIGP